MKTTVSSIVYNDMGKGMERTIELHVNDKEGRLVCLLREDGSVDDSLCPCCMTAKTRAEMMLMIEKSKIDFLIWSGSYRHAVPDYFPGIVLAEERNKSSLFKINRT